MAHVRVDLDFDTLAKWTSDGIAYVDAGGCVAAWSSAAAAVTGLPRDLAVGQSLEELFARIEPPLALAVVPQETQFWTNDERRHPLGATVLSVDDGWLVSFGREGQFAAIEQLKNEIVAAVSHELKTPIATIKAFATTMRENPNSLASSRDEFLATIEEQADRLARAVDDLLRVGRVDAKHLLSTRKTVALDRLIDDAVERLGPSAAARIERRSTGIGVSGDPELLAAALFHLIENALKFSPDGVPIAIEGDNGGDSAAVRICDRGIGIREEDIPYIFERFYRVDRSLNAATTGTGIGLTIVREIVQAHGGTIEIDSKPAAGTTVTVILPARGPEARSA
jgi:two-component system, OmpR family, phosphate regulon sensor histidine kinase PhoR